MGTLYKIVENSKNAEKCKEIKMMRITVMIMIMYCTQEKTMSTFDNVAGMDVFRCEVISCKFSYSQWLPESSSLLLLSSSEDMGTQGVGLK